MWCPNTTYEVTFELSCLCLQFNGNAGLIKKIKKKKKKKRGENWGKKKCSEKTSSTFFH